MRFVFHHSQHLQKYCFDIFAKASGSIEPLQCSLKQIEHLAGTVSQYSSSLASSSFASPSSELSSSSSSSSFESSNWLQKYSGKGCAKPFDSFTLGSTGIPSACKLSWNIRSVSSNGNAVPSVRKTLERISDHARGWRRCNSLTES